uniref:Uncharacterized protein n=1 Tax=Anguilla anguilla TaxID=7936 RepID=A0A0E9RZN4_ANGAN
MGRKFPYAMLEAKME